MIELAARLERAAGLGQREGRLRRMVDHLVGDGGVNLAIAQGQVLERTEAQLDVRPAALPAEPARALEHARGSVDSDDVRRP